MRHFQTLTAIAAASLALAACTNDNGSSTTTTGYLRVANGISDSDGLSLNVITDPTTLGPVAFGAASTLASVPIATYSPVLTPGASGASSFDISNVVVQQNDLVTVFGYGTLASGTQGGLTAEEALTAPPNGDAVIQAVHAAYQESQTTGASEFNFYFVTPGTGASFTPGTPTTSVAFGAVTAAQAVTIVGGTYEIIVTYAPCVPATSCGTQTVVFDSGPNGITFPFGYGSNTPGPNVFQLAAIDAGSTNQTQYGSPISLLLLNNAAGGIEYNLLLNGQN